jgi:hypothetical protein
MQLEISKWLYKYFSLNGSVAIPGLGILSLIRVPSTNDFANKLFYPPMYRYRFEHIPEISDEAMFSYLKTNLELTDDDLEQKLALFSQELTDHLNKLGEIDWEGVGSFQNKNNEVVFVPFNNTTYLDEIKYEHVVRETYSHDVLTGDRVQTSEDLHAYFEEQKSNKIWDRWKLFSMVILVISIALIIVRATYGNFSLLDARYDRVIPKQAGATYTLIKSF